MARSTFLYLIMLVCLGSGFEGIRRLGNTLIPPRHIAGQWRVTFPPSSSPCPVLEFKERENAGLQIEQSGRYLTLTFTDIHHTRLRAHFDNGELHGEVPISVPCAAGQWLHVTGHLLDGSLEIAMTRSQEKPERITSTLVLVATRSSEPDQSSPSSH